MTIGHCGVSYSLKIKTGTDRYITWYMKEMMEVVTEMRFKELANSCYIRQTEQW